jgi:hypothetical protein
MDPGNGSGSEWEQCLMEPCADIDTLLEWEEIHMAHADVWFVSTDTDVFEDTAEAMEDDDAGA